MISERFSYRHSHYQWKNGQWFVSNTLLAPIPKPINWERLGGEYLAFVLQKEQELFFEESD